MKAAPTVADTGASATIALGAQLLEARARGEANGLLIGGFSTADHGLIATSTGLRLLEQAARNGDLRADVAAHAASLEARAREVLERIEKLRATAVPAQQAA